MTIKKSLGKMITAGGFVGAGLFSLLSGLCRAFLISSYSNFWITCAGLFMDLVPIMLLVALFGYFIIYMATRDTLDLAVCLGIAATAFFTILTHNTTSLAWHIIAGLCATVYLAVFALQAKNEENLIFLILMACAAFYSILGYWLMDLIFFDDYSKALFVIGYLLSGVFELATFAVPAVHIFMSKTIAEKTEETERVSDSVDE